MMKRLFALLSVTLLLCFTLRADEAYNITLEKGDSQGKTEELAYGIIKFRLNEYGSHEAVLVTIENTTKAQAVLLFRESMDEKKLKKNKPKIEILKSYGGTKGKRSVFGCRELGEPVVAIIPAAQYAFSPIAVPSSSVIKLELPMYIAKIDPKQLDKKGPDKITYSILREEVVKFNIEVKGWSENDREYVATKSAVEDYIRSVNAAAFCKNKKHSPTLAQQQKPYKERKDSLVKGIEEIVETNGWMSDSAPYKAYKALRDELDEVNLNKHNYDCGEHRTVSRQPSHSCGYCSLSAQQIYHQLDDIYQRLRNGKSTKDSAVKQAKGLYTCYQKNGKRKKDSSYSDKISKFYNRIISF